MPGLLLLLLGVLGIHISIRMGASMQVLLYLFVDSDFTDVRSSQLPQMRFATRVLVLGSIPRTAITDLQCLVGLSSAIRLGARKFVSASPLLWM